MPRHSYCEMRVMQCMTYFFCASLQSCRRLYQMGDWLLHWYWFIARHLQRWESSHIWYIIESEYFYSLERENRMSIMLPEIDFKIIDILLEQQERDKNSNPYYLLRIYFWFLSCLSVMLFMSWLILRSVYPSSFASSELVISHICSFT